MNAIDTLKKIKDSVKLVDASPDIIKAVQQQLKTIDLYDYRVDGIAGPATVNAFVKFKRLEYLGHPELLGQTTAIALLEATEEHAVPTDDYEILPGEKTARLPVVGQVSSKMPVYPGSHFLWLEVTKNLSRLPTTVLEVQNIIKTARHLDDARKFLGDRAFTVTSWLRPKKINAEVKGASNSRHIYGDGVDFIVEGIHPLKVYDRLNEWHGKHGGLGKSSQFCHMDCRGNCRPRWLYGR